MTITAKQRRSWLARTWTLFQRLHELAQETDEGELHDMFMDAALALENALVTLEEWKPEPMIDEKRIDPNDLHRNP